MWSSVSVVIPVYNSEDSLKELIDNLSKVLESIFFDYEIILVDDFSTDNSFFRMKELYKSNSNLKIIRLNKNYGQQNAMKCGFEFAKNDFIITMDDDLQHPPEEIVKIVKKMDEGYDVVYGIAGKKEHNFIRNAGSKITDFLFNIICHKSKEVRVSSFRCIKKPLLDKIKRDRTNFVYITAITLKLTKKIGNVYINHKPRKYGNSNYTLFKLLKLFLKLFIYYSDIKLFKLFTRCQTQFEIYESYL